MKNKIKKFSKRIDSSVEVIKSRDIRHPLFIPVFALIIFFFMAIIIFISFSGTTVINSGSRVVNVYNNGREETVPTTATTVGQLLKRLDISLNPGDIVDPGQSTPILTNGFNINIYRVHPVNIIENNQRTVFMTANTSPRVIAQQAGYTIYPQDYVFNVNSATELNQNIIGQVIEIQPATLMQLDLYGTKVSLRTHASTVAQLLSENKIQISGSGTNVVPALSTPISTNLQVLVVPLGQKLVSREQTISYSTQYVNNPNVPYGAQSVAQAGQDGLELVVEDTTTTNGVVSTNPIQSVVVSQPINEIINRGTGVTSINGGNNIVWLRDSSIGASDYQYVNFIMTRESHWNPDDVNSRGCIGLGQFCNPLNLTVPCPDWQVDAVCQLNAFNNYANRVYGTWANAASHEANDGWW